MNQAQGATAGVVSRMKVRLQESGRSRQVVVQQAEAQKAMARARFDPAPLVPWTHGARLLNSMTAVTRQVERRF